MQPQKTVFFHFSTSARDDGTLEAAYIRIGEGKVAKTVEVREDILLADYDRRGKLIGIEILAPVRFADLASLVEKPKRKPLRRFVSNSASPHLVTA